MRLWQVLAVAGMLVFVNVGGWCLQNNYHSIVYPQTWDEVGVGFEAQDILLKPEEGAYVTLNVQAIDGRTVDVYFIDRAGLDRLYTNRTFEYDAQRSVLNITHVNMDLQLPSSSDRYGMIIASHDREEVVQVLWSAEQTSFPHDMMPAIQVIIIICEIANFALIVLLVYCLAHYGAGRKQERTI